MAVARRFAPSSAFSDMAPDAMRHVAAFCAPDAQRALGQAIIASKDTNKDSVDALRFIHTVTSPYHDLHASRRRVFNLAQAFLPWWTDRRLYWFLRVQYTTFQDTFNATIPGMDITLIAMKSYVDDADVGLTDYFEDDEGTTQIDLQYIEFIRRTVCTSDYFANFISLDLFHHGFDELNLEAHEQTKAYVHLRCDKLIAAHLDVLYSDNATELATYNTQNKIDRARAQCDKRISDLINSEL